MQAMIAIIITFSVIAAFATQIIDAPMIALLGSLAMMAAGIITPLDVVAPFGSDAVLMVAGVMILGDAVFETGLAGKIGNIVTGCEPLVRTEKRFLLSVLTIAAFLSAFLSNTATVAMFMPLIDSISKSDGGRIQKKNVLMAVGISAVMGGNCTLAGSTPQLTAQGILTEMPGVRNLTFFELAYVAVPLIAVMLLYYATIGYRLQEKYFDFAAEDSVGDIPVLSNSGSNKAALMGIIMLACITGFVLGIFSFGTVAILCACVCIITKCISSKKAFQAIDIRTITVLGGSLGFSKGLSQSGAINLLAEKLLFIINENNLPPCLICGIFIVIASLLGNIMSHTATVAILTPIGISTAMALMLDPIPFVVGIIIGSNLSFATPIGTPPLTMTLIAGYRFGDYARVGGLLNLITVIGAVLWIPVVYGL